MSGGGGHVLRKRRASLATLSPQRERGPRVVGLFAGIGGIELGLSRAGYRSTLLCEVQPTARQVLREQFPETEIWEDVRTLERLPRGTQLVAAGFPCQDLSQAGKTAGITGRRSGLIDEVFRLLEIAPTPWVLLENVPFMLHVDGGRAMTSVVSRLERLGYAWAYRVIDSRAFGLPQRRERVFLLAGRGRNPADVLLVDEAGAPEVDEHDLSRACGFYWTEGNKGLGWAWNAVPPLKGGTTLGSPTPPAILLPGGGIVKPDIRDAERLQGFPAGWTACLPKERQRWRLLGNAVSVPVAEWIGSRLCSPGKFEDEDRRSLGEGPWPRAAFNLGWGRRAVPLSAWPIRRRQVSLDRFLRYPPQLLSLRATSGFYDRVRGSSLRLPPGFVERLESHLDTMRRAERIA